MQTLTFKQPLVIPSKYLKNNNKNNNNKNLDKIIVSGINHDRSHETYYFNYKLLKDTDTELEHIGIKRLTCGNSILIPDHPIITKALLIEDMHISPDLIKELENWQGAICGDNYQITIRYLTNADNTICLYPYCYASFPFNRPLFEYPLPHSPPYFARPAYLFKSVYFELEKKMSGFMTMNAVFVMSDGSFEEVFTVEEKEIWRFSQQIKNNGYKDNRFNKYFKLNIAKEIRYHIAPEADF